MLLREGKRCLDDHLQAVERSVLGKTRQRAAL